MPRARKAKMETSTRRVTPRRFPPPRNFASLSVGDLLEARDAHHVFLSQLDNVVATAIGRYRIHEDDWYATNPPDVPRPKGVALVRAPRTLEFHRAAVVVAVGAGLRPRLAAAGHPRQPTGTAVSLPHGWQDHSHVRRARHTG